MKKSLLLVLVFVFMFASMSSAAMKLGVVGQFGAATWFNHPGLVITPGNLKDVNYDILVGYSSSGVGKDIEANVGMLIGGTWWMGQNGAITYGPTLVYYSQSLAHNDVYPSDKASDNTLTSLDLVFSMKAPLVAGIDVRADVLVLSMVSGRYDDEDVSSSYNQTLSTIQLGLQYTFPL